MTLTEIIDKARKLTAQERAELMEELHRMQAEPEAAAQPKTGAQIVAMLEALDGPIELVDSHIEDPVEWVKAQRRKRREHIKSYWGGEE